MQTPTPSVSPVCAYPGCCTASTLTKCELTPVIASANRLAGEPKVILCDAHRGKYCIVCGRLEIVAPGSVSQFHRVNSVLGRKLGLEATAPPENLKVGVCKRHAGKRALAEAADMPKGKYVKENVEPSPCCPPRTPGQFGTPRTPNCAPFMTPSPFCAAPTIITAQQQVGILMQELAECKKTMEHSAIVFKKQLYIKHLALVEQKKIVNELERQVKVLKWAPQKPWRQMSATSRSDARQKFLTELERMAGAEKLSLPDDYDYNGIESPTEDDILQCKEAEMREHFTDRYPVDISEPLKAILSYRRIKKYVVECTKDAVFTHVMPLDTTMLLRLKFAADIKKKGITNMKHYLKKWCSSYQDIRSKQQQMYDELNLPITYTVQGNPATKVNGPDYVAKFLSVPHWQQRCIVRKNAAGQTIIPVKISKDGMARGNYHDGTGELS